MVDLEGTRVEVLEEYGVLEGTRVEVLEGSCGSRGVWCSRGQ